MAENQEVKDQELQEEILEESEAANSCEAEAPEENTEEAAEAAEDVSEETEEAEKKGLFKKKKKDDKKDQKIAELEDRVKRQLAEFENFRNRTEKEKTHMYEIGAKDIIEKMLPIVDSFERGLATVPEEQKEDPFVQGMDKIYKQLTTTLSELGVQPIEAVGQPFDSNLHNAVMHVEDENLGENVVAAEFQKGYTYRDSVVRHSMVSVAN